MAAARRNGPLSALALADYSDRELLIVIDEAAAGAEDPDGATSGEIAVALGMAGKAPARNVGTRLAYMRRVGLVERPDDGKPPTRWQLSKLGRRIAFGTADPETAKRLQAARAEDVWAFAHALGGAHRRLPDGARAVMRREWRRANGLP